MPDADLGVVAMPNVLFRLSETPGAIRWAGPRLGEHNRAVLAEVGVDNSSYTRLVAAGVVIKPSGAT